MKLPKDIGGEKLCGLIGKYGYQKVRQTGSHIRVTLTTKDEQHHLSIPNHSPLKTGTLSRILSDISSHLGIEKKELIEKLFG